MQGEFSMNQKTFTINNISCGHCTNTIKNELAEVPGVAAVEAEPGAKDVTVKWEAPATEDSIRSVLAEINYPAA
jgi:copper chaperone